MVRERNWLDVYPYTTWGGKDALPVFQQGQTFTPHELLLKDVRVIRLYFCQACQIKFHCSACILGVGGCLLRRWLLLRA